MSRVGHAGTWRWIGVLVLVGCGHGSGPAGDPVDAAVAVDAPSPPPDAAAPCTMTITGAISAVGACQVVISPHSLDGSHPAELTAQLLSHVADSIDISDYAVGGYGAPRSPLTEQSDIYVYWMGRIDDGTNSWTLSRGGGPGPSGHIGTFTLDYQSNVLDQHQRYTQAHGTLDATLVSATAGTVTVHVAFSQSY